MNLNLKLLRRKALCSLPFQQLRRSMKAYQKPQESRLCLGFNICSIKSLIAKCRFHPVMTLNPIGSHLLGERPNIYWRLFPNENARKDLQLFTTQLLERRKNLYFQRALVEGQERNFSYLLSLK